MFSLLKSLLLSRTLLPEITSKTIPMGTRDNKFQTVQRNLANRGRISSSVSLPQYFQLVFHMNFKICFYAALSPLFSRTLIRSLNAWRELRENWTSAQNPPSTCACFSLASLAFSFACINRFSTKISLEKIF